jgi:isopentenyl-diphosphate delta-isomerase
MDRIPDTPERMELRKNDHIELCVSTDVESRPDRFERWQLLPEALPTFAFDALSTERTFLGRAFQMPILVTGMTGGVERGRFVNEVLATVAARRGIPMGLGSQKMMLVNPQYRELFDVKKSQPDVFVIGNLGLASFNYGVTVDQILSLVDALQLDAFAFHLNALQECIQPEGETNFAGLLPRLEEACRRLPVPVMVKEVGSGVTASTARRLVEAGVSALDVGGSSGTSWGLIEGLRGSSVQKRLGELFRNWGLTTAESLVEVSQALEGAPQRPSLVATGGIRDGVQVAKAVALGASMVGVGLPFLRAIMRHPSSVDRAVEALDEEIAFFEQGLRIAMFASGCRNLEDLSARLRRSQ